MNEGGKIQLIPLHLTDVYITWPVSSLTEQRSAVFFTLAPSLPADMISNGVIFFPPGNNNYDEKGVIPNGITWICQEISSKINARR